MIFPAEILVGLALVTTPAEAPLTPVQWMTASTMCNDWPPPMSRWAKPVGFTDRQWEMVTTLCAKLHEYGHKRLEERKND